MFAPQSPSLRVRVPARRHFPVALLLILAAASLGAALFASLRTAEAVGRADEKVAVDASAQEPKAAAEAYGKLPLQFEANRGQTDERVRFISRGDGYVMFLTGDEAVLALNRGGAKDAAKDSKSEQGYSVLRMRLAGASASAKVEGLEELSGKVNYFVGGDASEWRTNVPVFGRVHYTSVYPGIDLVYYGNQRQLEYDFNVAPGADPRVIKLKFEGVERAEVDKQDGSLTLHVGGGEVRMKRPVIYQTADDGSRREIEGGYKVKGREVEFNVGSYDAGRPLVIDPVLSYSTFIGIQNTSNFASAPSFTLDSSGNAYITGAAASLAFPAPGVKLIPQGSGSMHVFVTKLNAAGTSLVYTSYIGGFSEEIGLGVALDSTGAAYVTGRTTSADFPTTSNALRANDDLIKSADGGATWQRSNAGLQNRSVTRMWADPVSAPVLYAITFNGLYKTTDGGANWNLLNTGLTSPGFTFVSALAIAPSNPSILYAANSGTTPKLVKSTDGGATWTTPANSGFSSTGVSGLGVDPTNPNVVYAGTAFSVIKTTDGGATWTQVNTGITFGDVSSFVFDPANTSVIYAVGGGSGGVFKTTDGGGNWTRMNAGMDSNTFVSSLFMLPSNSSTLYAGTSTGVFKTTNGAGNWTPVNTGLTNLFVRSLAYDPAAPSTVYAGTTKSGIFKTTNGGANWTQVHSGISSATVLALAVSASSQVYAGTNILVGGSNIDTEAFFFKLSPAGDALVYSTYLGGNGDDEGDAIAVDSSGNAYIVGSTGSADFPLAGPRASSLHGTNDAFVTKFNAAGTSLLFSTLVGGAQTEFARSVALDSAGNAYACGETTSADFPVTPGAFSTTFSGQPPFLNGKDGFVFKLDSAGSALNYATYLGGNDDDRANDIAIDSSGNAYVTGSTSSTNFPLLNAALSTTSGGFNSSNGYATKLNSTGSALVYSTYLGGGSSQSIALDSAGAAYLTGLTASINFPVTPDTLKSHSPLYRTNDSGASWDNLNFGLSAGSLSGNSGFFHGLVADPLKRGFLYASSDDGVYKSTNNGRTWSRASNGITAQRIDTLAIDPKTTTTLYAGSGLASFNTPTVFKTTDGGANWSPLASTSAFQFVSVLAVDPVTPSNVYAYNGSVVKSTDGGATWNPPGNNSPNSVTSIAIDPSNSSNVYAAGNGGVFKTTDGGANWSPANNGMPNPVSVGGVAIDFAHPSTLYANTVDGVFKTTDGASTWTRSLSGSGFSGLLVVDPSDTSTVYAYVGQQTGSFTFIGALYRTIDGGANWTKLTGTPNLTLNTLVVDPFTRANLYVIVNTLSFGDTDAFLTKLSPAGNSFAYVTLLGGGTAASSISGTSDQGTAVAVDAQGAAYVVGTSSTSDFPVTLGSFLPYNRGGADVFISKLVTAPSIGGVVTDASNVPQQGVKITLHSSVVLSTQLTGAAGTFLFTNLPAGGTYFVSATKTGASLTPQMQTFSDLTTDQTANFTLGDGVASHKISGHIQESNSTPVSGAFVILSGSQFEQTKTDASGNYSFTAPAGGSYTVTVTAPVFSFSPSSPAIDNLTSDRTVNFTATRQDLIVSNTNDAGPNSLREAITFANETPGKDRITFNIPGTGVRTIALNTALPDIVDPVSIDGSTQPGYAGQPLVELSGANIASTNFGGVGGSGLTITAGDSLVRALVINGFHGSGVVLSGGSNNHVEGNIIGLDATGTVKLPNTGIGVIIQNSSSNVVGGTSPAQRNVISANGSDGVLIAAADNRVIGNFIGTDITGTQKFDNIGSGNGWGVRVGDGSPQTSTGNVVGGTEPGAGNLISGNQAGGVLAAGAGTVVQGNLIGTNVSGTGKLPNGVGVKSSGSNIVVGGTIAAARNVISGNFIGAQLETFFLNASVTFKGNYVGTDPTGSIAIGNGTGVNSSGATVIGGAETGAGNLISGNDGTGIMLTSSGGATIKGNLIGTDASGALALGNGTGIDFETSQTIVGGAEAGARNVISGNGVGINVGGSVSSGGTSNVVRGNIIGLNAAANAPLPNTSYGINLRDGSGNIFGGDAAGEGNTIAFNGAAGVLVNSFASNNSFRGNSIFSNARLGIDLLDQVNGGEGLTPNDAGDADDGGNHLQNFPTVNSFANVGGSINVKGALGSKPSTQYQIDFYSNAACDASGNGEGARPLGNTMLTTDASGNASFDVTLAGQLAQGRVVTATATDPQGNTSEFSPCDASATVGSVEFAGVSFNVLEDVGSAVIRVARRGGSRGTLTVNYTTGGGTATAGADYTPASGTLTFAEGETLKTFAVPIANDGTDEPEETVGLALSGPLDLESFGANMHATIHIFDADTPVVIGVDGLDISSIPLAEGDVGTTNRPVALRLNAASGHTVTVDFNVSGGTTAGVATPNVDFVPVSGTVTFNPGEETKNINIPVIGDTIDEFNELLILSLANPSGATLSFSEASLNIVDDDAPPQLSVTDVSVVEGAGAKAVFSVRLSQPSGRIVTVGFATADGTATAGNDYSFSTGPLSFTVGQTLKTVEVPILADAAAEPDENFFLNVTVAPSNQSRVTIADGQGQATIVDSGSSSASLVQFSASSYSVSETGGQTQITVTRTGNTSGAASVGYKTVSQSASERSDFTASLGTLRFAAGETQKTFTVLVTDDRFLEGAESLDLVLSNPAGASLGGPNVSSLNIVSDDTTDGPSPVRDDAFDTEFFVRQHYHDFLNREPDASGLAFWKNEIDSCGANAQCREVKKINVSGAFFLSIEFQETGYHVYRTYKAAYGDTTSPNVAGTVPIVRLQEFLPDSQRIGQGLQVGVGDWQAKLEANKQDYMLEFVQRQRFLDAFPLTLTAAEFVDKLNQNSGGVLSQSERDLLVANLAASADQTQGRAAALRAVAEDTDLRNGEKNRAFVLMQFYGYLRRNPDDPQDTDFRGWKFWLGKLEEFNGNFVRAEMVKAFLASDEYRKRFGQ